MKNGKGDLMDDKEDEIVINGMECEIERPKKQKQYYSGKKKKHTIKVEFVDSTRQERTTLI